MHKRSRALQPHILYKNDVCITPLILFLLFVEKQQIHYRNISLLQKAEGLDNFIDLIIRRFVNN